MICFCGNPATECAHFPRTKGAGGKARVPMCRAHHHRYHDLNSGVYTFIAEHPEFMVALIKRNRFAAEEWIAGLYPELVE